jgi:predicted phosphohydrolase
VEEGLKLVLWDEIQETFRLLEFKFKKADQIEDFLISSRHFKNIVRSTKFLTPKEKNLLVRMQKQDKVDYRKFPDMLFHVRSELSRSQLTDFGLSELEAQVYSEFHKFDREEQGVVNVRECEKALASCKKLNLTPF